MREDLNGSRVLRRDATVFVKLPRGAWREIEHGCQCQHCKAVPGRKAYWDTLAVPAAKPEGPDTAWLVHQPEGHPEALRGDEVDREKVA